MIGCLNMVEVVRYVMGLLHKVSKVLKVLDFQHFFACCSLAVALKCGV